VDLPHRAEIHSPWDGARAGSIPVAGLPETARAVDAAVAASDVMRGLSRWNRSQLLRRIAGGIEARAPEFAALITRESGKPIRYARGEVARAVSTFTFAAEEANRAGGELVPLDVTPAAEGYAGFTLQVPVGPVCAIAPFNFPLNLVAHKVAPAIAAGCPVVLKPPPQAPLTSCLLAEVVMDAGLPPGALNVLHLEIPDAERLVVDPRLRMVSFTGSARVGWHIKRLAATKRVVLELGGNAGCVIHEDADLDWALERVVAGCFASSGQVCIRIQRLFVHRGVYDRFVGGLVAAARELKCGDPMDPETVVGPVIDDAAANRIELWIEEARDAGARVLCGGTRNGRMIAPTLLEGAGRETKVWCEEVFGPVTTVEPYEDFGDALRRVNDSDYGLQAAVFTNDLKRVKQAVERLEVGGVIVNDSPAFRVDNMPYGGAKLSGFGREGVRYAIGEMSELRTVVLRIP
jgi:glyceraldehyde-3-phosphate dehydrogenase (NADP+)